MTKEYIERGKGRGHNRRTRAPRLVQGQTEGLESARIHHRPGRPEHVQCSLSSHAPSEDDLVSMTLRNPLVQDLRHRPILTERPAVGTNENEPCRRVSIED